MPLFRWRFGTTSSGTPAAAGSTSQDDNNNNPLPPSYEESQDASLRTVLQGAKAVAPLLWDSACGSLNTTKNAPSSFALEDNQCPDSGGKGKEKQDDKYTIPSPGTEEEDIIMTVLANLAMVSCGNHPFLDRIRQFSDFYFTPYMASESSSSQERDNNSSSFHACAESTQERQRKALQDLDVPRESATLVLCARVLEDYYAGLGHVDSRVDVDILQKPSTSYPQCPNGKNTGSSSAAATTKGGQSEHSSTPPPRTKTSLTQIAACLERGCACCDYDAAAPETDSPHQPPCGCGHPRTSHTSLPLGISRLLRRYTNWESVPYGTLRHRSSQGRIKRRIHDIKVCGAPGGCPCRDYDKGRRTARCAQCGHYSPAHMPVGATHEPGKKHTKKREIWKGKGRSSTAGSNDPKKVEWELSWILVENAYLLLDHIAPISRGKHS
ncbi:hypothetical protein F4803DRAFT_220420 [Xylaria telfairii]|nr:hypothetical protein F4803DRAFT_220420 [Xylaria telfairii]